MKIFCSKRFIFKTLQKTCSWIFNKSCNLRNNFTARFIQKNLIHNNSVVNFIHIIHRIVHIFYKTFVWENERKFQHLTLDYIHSSSSLCVELRIIILNSSRLCRIFIIIPFSRKMFQCCSVWNYTFESLWGVVDFFFKAPPQNPDSICGLLIAFAHFEMTF